MPYVPRQYVGGHVVHQPLSITHMSLGWAWHDAKNAAALACELIRWALPPVRWTRADAPEITELEQRLGCEQPAGDDPYRVSGEQRVCADPQEVTDARFYVATALSFVSALANGETPEPPADAGSPEEHPLTRLYWYASYLGTKTIEMCNSAANATYQLAIATGPSIPGMTKITVPAGVTELKQRWYATGHAVQAACEFIRKFASSNPVVGDSNGAAGAILFKIGSSLAHAGQPTDEIIGRMFHWRVKDALKGKELTPELEANLRPAFEAAWTAGEYEIAYSLLDDLDVTVEPC